MLPLIATTGQRGDGACQLLESGAGEPLLKVTERNGSIGVSRTDERLGQCSDLHWVSSLVVDEILPARA